MPGGALHKVWAPYALYGTVDYIYGWPAFKARNGFTSAQGSLNVVETLCYLFYLRIVWTHGKSIGARGRLENPKRSVAWFLFEEKHVDGRMGAIALLAVFSASVMTLSKTILYGELPFERRSGECGCHGIENDTPLFSSLWLRPDHQLY